MTDDQSNPATRDSASGGLSPAAGADPFRDAVVVVIPAYNEAARVGEVVREVRRRYPAVVVIDDGSRDATAEVARAAGAVVLQHPINRGQGAALQTGLSFALRHGAAYIVTFDSDGQHDPDDIEALLAPLRRGDWEISLGSRFLGRTENMPGARRVLLKLGVVFTRVCSGVRLTDVHNGLRAFTRRAAERIDITLDRMAHASELIDQIRDSGLAYGEVPVTIRYTDYSRAKGQRSRAAFRILWDYFVKRVSQ
jgi:glycosyltransferase involved in cell wall biosynthesis